jgi:hypothetical protein
MGYFMHSCNPDPQALQSKDELGYRPQIIITWLPTLELTALDRADHFLILMAAEYLVPAKLFIL